MKNNTLEAFRLIITEVEDKELLDKTVKKAFPILFRMRSGGIESGEFCTSYGIVEATKVRDMLNKSGAKVRIEKV